MSNSGSEQKSKNSFKQIAQGIPIGITMGILLSAIIVKQFFVLEHHYRDVKIMEANIPEPDLKINRLDFSCLGWKINRTENFIGVSDKVWLCDNNHVEYDESGVRLPKIDFKKIEDE